jgi:hypothetical protein
MDVRNIDTGPRYSVWVGMLLVFELCKHIKSKNQSDVYFILAGPPQAASKCSAEGRIYMDGWAGGKERYPLQ